MGHFEVRLLTPLRAAEAYARIVDLDAHTALIPLTRVRHPGVLGVGSTFVARTGIGPVGIDDTMVVEDWAPPRAGVQGRCGFRKTGRWIRGSISVRVAEGERGSVVTWSQDISIRGLSWVPADRIVTIVARFAYRAVLRRLLAYGRPAHPSPAEARPDNDRSAHAQRAPRGQGQGSDTPGRHA